MPERNTETFDDLLKRSAFLFCVEFLGKTYTGVEYRKKFYYTKKPKKPCWQCEAATKWVSLPLEVFICSPRCADEIYEDIAEARRPKIIYGQVL